MNDRHSQPSADSPAGSSGQHRTPTGYQAFLSIPGLGHNLPLETWPTIIEAITGTTSRRN